MGNNSSKGTSSPTPAKPAVPLSPARPSGTQSSLVSNGLAGSATRAVCKNGHEMTQTNKAGPKNGEIHVLSLDGGGSRGIMESIMLGHVMDLSTLMTVKPSKITEILDNFQLDGPEVGKKFQCLIELENLSPIHPTEAFQYIVGK